MRVCQIERQHALAGAPFGLHETDDHVYDLPECETTPDDQDRALVTGSPQFITRHAAEG
jgi:hypothetical protein